jgi:hypothetical protein
VLNLSSGCPPALRHHDRGHRAARTAYDPDLADDTQFSTELVFDRP